MTADFRVKEKSLEELLKVCVIARLSHSDKSVLESFDFVQEINEIIEPPPSFLYELALYDGNISCIASEGSVPTHIDDLRVVRSWNYLLIAYSKDSAIYTTDQQDSGNILSSVNCRAGDIIRLNIGQWHGLKHGAAPFVIDIGASGQLTWVAFHYQLDSPDDSKAIAYFDRHLTYLKTLLAHRAVMARQKELLPFLPEGDKK
jgi:hypothetical protein